MQIEIGMFREIELVYELLCTRGTLHGEMELQRDWPQPKSSRCEEDLASHAEAG